jgi:two-component system response regulator HydG
MRELRTLIGRVANAPSPVLIFGETGTGKETVARAIHVESERRDGSFVALNCAALPEMLLDSELFGNPGGAPSGVSKTHRGHLAEADGGTLFLDEVGDMSLPLQAKFLRVLQSGELRSGGHEATSRVDVRCVASTQRDLFSMVQDGKFREDLYFRLNVVPIRIPALRERQEDVALLVNHFLAHRGPVPRLGPALVFTPEALRLLESHPWPGNVRELENLIERLVVTASRSPIDVEALRPELTPSFPGDPVQSLVRARVPLDELERRYIAAVLRHTEGNKTKAAAILKIDLSTLYRREKGQQH